jgi:hypothetical protein
MVPLSGIKGLAFHPRGGRPGEKAHAVWVVFVSFRETGQPARTTSVVRKRPKLAVSGAMSCLLMNGWVLARGHAQVKGTQKEFGSDPSLRYPATAIYIRPS